MRCFHTASHHSVISAYFPSFRLRKERRKIRSELKCWCVGGEIFETVLLCWSFSMLPPLDFKAEIWKKGDNVVVVFVTLYTKRLRSDARALSVSCLSLRRPFTPSATRPHRSEKENLGVGRQPIAKYRQSWITSCIQYCQKLVGGFREKLLPTISFWFFLSFNLFFISFLT